MTEKVLVNRVIEIMREKQSYRFKYRLGESEFDKLVRQVVNLTLQELKNKNHKLSSVPTTLLVQAIGGKKV